MQPWKKRNSMAMLRKGRRLLRHPCFFFFHLFSLATSCSLFDYSSFCFSFSPSGKGGCTKMNGIARFKKKRRDWTSGRPKLTMRSRALP